MSTRRLIAYDDLKFKGIRYSKVHLSRLEKQKKFPKRVPLGPARYGYVEEEIDQYIESLIAARDFASEVT
jgi:prophage regulatory protein